MAKPGHVARKERTRAELRRASRDLMYELAMLKKTNQVLERLGPAEKDDEINKVIRNALIESFVLHARALLDFFYPENPKADDVIVDDFFKMGSEWCKLCPPKSTLLSTVHKRVGKEIAHLTYARQKVTIDEKRWRHSEISREISELMAKFLKEVDRCKLDPEDYSTLKDAPPRLANQGISPVSHTSGKLRPV